MPGARPSAGDPGCRPRISTSGRCNFANVVGPQAQVPRRVAASGPARLGNAGACCLRLDSPRLCAGQSWCTVHYYVVIPQSIFRPAISRLVSSRICCGDKNVPRNGLFPNPETGPQKTMPGLHYRRNASRDAYLFQSAGSCSQPEPANDSSTPTHHNHGTLR